MSLESNITTTTTTSLLSPPTQHKNLQLQQKINQNKNNSVLDLGCSNLADDDMETVASYLLVNNKVSLPVVILKKTKIKY